MGIGSLVGMAAGLIINAFTGAGDSAADAARAEEEARKAKLEAEAIHAKGQRDKYRGLAGKNKANAENTLDFGADIKEQAAEKWTVTKRALSGKQGKNVLKIGSSSVEMKGSAAGLLKSNAERMNADLNAILNTAENKYDQILRERRGLLDQMRINEDLAAKWNAQSGKYRDAASNIDPQAAADAARAQNTLSFVSVGGQIGSAFDDINVSTMWSGVSDSVGDAWNSVFG